jgi:uncharacterized protein YrzB (UPF0473 family)
VHDELGGDLITLTDDDGVEYELEHLDTLEDKGVTYMAFIPADTPDEQTEVDFIILKSTEEDGEEVLSTLDDDTEAERIYDLFMLRLSEDDDDEDDDDEGDDDNGEADA